MKRLISLRFRQFGNRDSSPARYNFGNFFLCHALMNHRLVAGLCLFFGFLQLFLHSRQIPVLQLCRFFKVIIVFRHFNLVADSFQFGLQTVHLFHRTSLIVPFRLFSGKLFAEFGKLFLQIRETLFTQIVRFFFQCSFFNLQLHDVALHVIQFGRQRIQLGFDERTRFIDKVDRLIRKETVGNVTV